MRGGSVGERDRDHFGRPSRQKRAHPFRVFCCAIARMPEDGDGPCFTALACQNANPS
jgi:hypothetical protein